MGTRNRKLWSSKTAIKLLTAGKLKLGKVVCRLRMSPVIDDKDVANVEEKIIYSRSAKLTLYVCFGLDNLRHQDGYN